MTHDTRHTTHDELLRDIFPKKGFSGALFFSRVRPPGTCSRGTWYQVRSTVASILVVLVLHGFEGYSRGASTRVTVKSTGNMIVKEYSSTRILVYATATYYNILPVP